MRLLIENLRFVEAPSGKSYWTYWVRFYLGTESISVSGWKYQPDTDAIGTPSQLKAAGRFINTTKMTAGVYNAVLDEVRHVLHVGEK